MRGQHLPFDYQKWLLSVFFFLCGLWVVAQNEIIFIDDTSEVLIGVQVEVIGTDQGYISDEYGVVRLNSSESRNQIIRCSYLGFNSVEILVDDIESYPYSIVLIPSDIILKELVIVGRNNESLSKMISHVEMLNENQIKQLKVQNSADVLMNSGDVFVQKSQYGGGSPILRGFEANKLLLVVDGVRMNNAIYRNGHLQNAITIDHNSLSRMEILFGPGSLIYGSDALGGVIHFRTKSPKFSNSKQWNKKLNLSSSINSVNNGVSIHGDFALANQWISSFTSISRNIFGDLKMGSKNRLEGYEDFGKRFIYASFENGKDTLINNPNPSVQVGSGYSQWDFLQKTNFKISSTTELGLNVQYSTSSNVPRYDALIEEESSGLVFSNWYYGPQNRFMVSPVLRITNPTKVFDRLQIITAFQRLREDRINRRFGSTAENYNEEDIDVYSTTIDANKGLSENLTLQYGVDFQGNIVNSIAYTRDIVTDERNENILTRYADGSNTLWNGGIYGKVKWFNDDESWNVSVGARQTLQSAFLSYNDSPVFQWPDYYYDGISSQSSALVWNVQARYKFDFVSIYSNIGTAFRAPNIDDLSKIRVKGDELTVPNPDLDPEKTLNFEIGAQAMLKHHTFRLNGFNARLTNAIIREDYTLPTGESMYISDGDTLNITANVNAVKAHVRGISIKMESNWTTFLKSSVSFNITEGIILLDNEESSPLGHIPPTFGKAQVSYTKPNWNTGLSLLYNGWKRIENFGGSVDNPELATAEGSPSWYIINWGFDYQFQQIGLGVGVENILDHYYRPFASGISGAGRNYKFTINYNL